MYSTVSKYTETYKKEFIIKNSIAILNKKVFFVTLFNLNRNKICRATLYTKKCIKLICIYKKCNFVHKVKSVLCVK